MDDSSARPTRLSAPYAPVHAFLDEAGLRPDFATRALARIEAHHHELGDSYKWASLAGLVRELAEESADSAARASLIAARIEHDGGDAQRARALLAAIAQHADAANVLVGELRQVLEIPS